VATLIINCNPLETYSVVGSRELPLILLFMAIYLVLDTKRQSSNGKIVRSGQPLTDSTPLVAGESGWGGMGLRGGGYIEG